MNDVTTIFFTVTSEQVKELAFNAVKDGMFILDFINQFEHSGDRELARYEFKRAQSILRETLPHLFKS